MENQAQQQQQQQAVPTMLEMALLLNCQLTKLYTIQYQYGLAYIMWYLPTDERKRRILEGSKIFWQWFKLQWEIHDDAILKDPDFATASINERRRWYQVVHEPQALANEVKPNSIVLAELTKTQQLCSTI